MAEQAAHPGRSCPVSYRYGPGALQRCAQIEAETLYIAGGLYGNPFALDALLDLVARDPGAQLVFNGDFNWFDIDPADFQRVNESVLEHHATRGNVETELALPAGGAGCGCGYPDWVGDAEVDRSNRIMDRLRETAAGHPYLTTRLGALPAYLAARIGDVRIGIVHGDGDSLAGWGFSQELLATEGGRADAGASFAAAGVRIFASSHTCLPVLQRFDEAGGERAIVNNGAAGMPNFLGTRYGLATRISVHRPPPAGVYGASIGGVLVDAVRIDYDAAAWEARFLANWPEGSDAHTSYYGRIRNGPRYAVEQAMRPASRARGSNLTV
jgi:hypothetical protein